MFNKNVIKSVSDDDDEEEHKEMMMWLIFTGPQVLDVSCVI